jgi:carbamoyltransferase
MNILGINAFHADASAAVVRDGQVCAAIAEERLGPRVKHFAGFPSLAIEHVLKSARLRLGDLDVVAVGHDPRANLLPKLRYAARHPARSVRSAITSLRRSRRLADLRDLVAQAVGEDPAKARFRIEYVEHHHAHLASSYYLSGGQVAAGFSYDASGDFVSGAYASCERNVEVIRRVFLPHSLGYFYSSICQFIGFTRFGEEYKVMGLAAYGEPRYLSEMAKIVSYQGGGRYTIDRSYFAGLLQVGHEQLVGDDGTIELPPLYSPKLVDEFGLARRNSGEITQRDRDLAASCQLHFENVVIDCVSWLHKAVPSELLVTAGGCALNGVCNARILRDTPFKKMFIHGAASDDGTAVGAALETWARMRSGGEPPPQSSPYLGGSYAGTDVEFAAVEASTYPWQHLGTEALVDMAVSDLVAGRVVGWFQGRSEWGPRALGNRSILAHPGIANMKDVINAKIKRRESFRPFAPSVLATRVADLFEQDVDSPYMMHVVRFRPEYRDRLAAVCHADGTGRLQSVRAADNPLYSQLIAAFAERTGLPALLNTSFNENEPIVETPAEAVACFERTDMDVLYVGRYRLSKE